MTNNARQRKNCDKRSRPKSWCAPCSRVDLANPVALNNNGFPKQALWHGNKCDETDTFNVNVVNHEFVYRRISCSSNNLKFAVNGHNGSISRDTLAHAGTLQSSNHYDDNNNVASNQNLYAGDVPKVIRRNNVDRNARRAVVSLNLEKEYRTNVDQCGLPRTKKCRPKSVYQNIFRRSRNFVRCHIFGDNSRQKTYADASLTLASYQNENIFIRNSEKMMNGTIITDGESCMFHEDTLPGNGICIPYNGIYFRHTKEDTPTSVTDASQGFSVNTVQSKEDYVDPKYASLTNLLPWTKREMPMPEDNEVFSEDFQCRRDTRKFSSLRSPKSKGETPSAIASPCGTVRSASQSCIFKRHSSENLRLTRASSARYYRNNSMDGGMSRKTANCLSQDRIIDDNIKNINPKMMKTKRGQSRNAPNFFIRYQDVLREDSITEAPISSCDTSKFMQINEVFEYLLNLHCTKPVTKTCKQLFYIRSRLSKNARKNDTMCDGCFGCDMEGGHIIKSRQ